MLLENSSCEVHTYISVFFDSHKIFLKICFTFLFSNCKNLMYLQLVMLFQLFWGIKMIAATLYLSLKNQYE